MKTILFAIALLTQFVLNAQVNQFKAVSLSPPLFTVSPTSFATGDVTLTFSLDLQNPNKVFAGPSSGITDIAPTFRSLVIADVPFAVNTSDVQSSIGGAKTFTSDMSILSANLTISGTGKKLIVPDGSVTIPSLAFTFISTSGLSYSHSGSGASLLENITGSFSAVSRFEFRSNGTLNLNNNHDGAFLAGTQHLDVNIFHQSQDDGEDGGVSTSTDGKFDAGGGMFKYHTCTFGGRTSGGTYDIQANTVKDQALVAFIGKGYADGWESTNRGAFEVYAAQNHSTTEQSAYCVIQTTRGGPYNDTDNKLNDHISFLVDPNGNAGLVNINTIGNNKPSAWAGGVDDRFFCMETLSTSSDLGFFMQNSNASRGLNLWFDNSAKTTYFDNLISNNNGKMQTRLKVAGSPIVAITTGVFDPGTGTVVGGTNFGTDDSPKNVLTVGNSTNQTQFDGTGKITKYADATTAIADGQLLIGKNSGSTFEKGAITASNGTKVTNGAGTIALETDINTLTTDATPDRSADYLMTYDASATANKKVLINNFTGVVATVDLTNQSAAIVATPIYTTPSAGMFRVSFNGKVTTTATTSSIIGPFQFKYTSNDDGVVATGPSNNTNGINQSNNNSLTTAIVSGSYLVNAQSGTAIQYIMGYSSSGATAMIYSLHIKVEAL